MSWTRAEIFKSLTFERLAALLLLAGIAAAACLMPAQNDTWWHLRAGESIWNARRVILRDEFSFTVYGSYWPDHEWLSQVIFYGLFHIGGIRLVTAFAAAVVVASWALIWRITPGPLWQRVVLCVLAVIPAATQWSLRPQVLTLFFLACTAWLIVRRKHHFAPLLFVLWANAHAAVMIGIAVMGVVAFVSTIRERALITRDLVIAAGCFIATLLTPLGASLWLEMPAAIRRSRAYGIAEWQPPSIWEPKMAPFWLLAVTLVVLLILTYRKKLPDFERPLEWTAAALLVPALTSGRNVAPFLMLVVPVVSDLLVRNGYALKARSVYRQAALANAAVLALACTTSIGIVAHSWTSEVSLLGWRPIAPAAIQAASSCPENMYNRYDDGGYLIWFVRAQKVFMDGRQDPYPEWMVREHMRVEQSGDYRELFTRYRIRCAVLPPSSAVADRLRADGWHEAHRDEAWTVWIEPRPGS